MVATPAARLRLRNCSLRLKVWALPSSDDVCTHSPTPRAYQGSITASGLASVNAKTPLGHHSLSPVPLLGPPLSLLLHAALVAHGRRGLLLTRAWLSLDTVETLSPTLD